MLHGKLSLHFNRLRICHLQRGRQCSGGFVDWSTETAKWIGTDEHFEQNVFTHSTIAWEHIREGGSGYEPFFLLTFCRVQQVPFFVEKFRSLLSMLQIITSSLVIAVDEEFIGHIANKLLHFISSIKSLAQTGSNLNKNCLLVLSNLMQSCDYDVILCIYDRAYGRESNLLLFVVPF